MAAVVQVEKAAFAATWRDEETGEILGYTLGTTMCQSPRRPWAMTGTDDEWQFALPCGECGNCLERIRRNLADRHVKKYGKDGPPLWLIRIWYPKELQAELAHKLHRRKDLELEPGFYRLGVDSFAVLARSKALAPRVLRRLKLRHHVEPIRLSRGRRAWRKLTAGLLVARVQYGEQTKRWYARGLPPAARLKWDVVKKAMQKPWRRRTGARVRTGSKIILVPPAIWSIDGDRMKEYRAAAAAAISPEEALANRRRVAELVAGASSGFKLVAPAQPALTREQVQAFYVAMAQRKRAAQSETPVASLNPSTLLGGGLRSSVHSGNAPPIEIPPDEELAKLKRTGISLLTAQIPDKRARDEVHQRWQRLNFALELKEWTERMKSKIRGG